jgi:RND family efflux transporter MFP subunit
MARRLLCLFIIGTLTGFAGALPAAGGEYTVVREETTDLKAVYGQVLSSDVIPARARIAGTVVDLQVEEGSRISAGDVIAVVRDEKLALQMRAIDARLASLEAELANAGDELTRAETLLAQGVTTRQRVDQLRTAFEVVTGQIAAANAERAVVEQQTAEGQVIAPGSGRVIQVPVTRGSVVLAGETVAQVAGGGFFLRLALPERHAAMLHEGLEVHMEGRPSQPGAQALTAGAIAKIYPELENGQVIADVEVPGLEDYYVGERTLVRVPVARRMAIMIPAAAVATRSGIDFVTIVAGEGTREVSVVLGGAHGADDGRVEVLSGLREGDTVVVP